MSTSVAYAADLKVPLSSALVAVRGLGEGGDSYLNKLGRKRGVKVNLGLSLLFSLIVLIIVFITAALTSVIGYILYQTGAVNPSRRNPLWIMAILFLVSIVISTIISVVSKEVYAMTDTTNH